MRTVISMILGVMLVTPGSAAENKSHMQTLSNVSKAKAETQKEL